MVVSHSLCACFLSSQLILFPCQYLRGYFRLETLRPVLKKCVSIAGCDASWQDAGVEGWLSLREVCPCCHLGWIWALLALSQHIVLFVPVFNAQVVPRETPISGAGTLWGSLSPSLTSVANWERFPSVSWGRGGGFMNRRYAFLVWSRHILHPHPPGSIKAPFVWQIAKGFMNTALTFSSC